MAKLDKGKFPQGTGPSDWQCFGPAATKDGEFDIVKIADLGCFNQSGVDSNKYYHASIVKHKTTGQWGVYFEWGRTGAKTPQFQFVPCSSEAEAQRIFAAQLHEKNDKRGEWATIAGIRTLRAKANKDCYLVRPQATRSTGLPDARSIKSNDAPVLKKTTSTKPIGKTLDPQTLDLMQSLNVATVSYTRGAMADSSIPTQQAIEEGRQILTEAQKRVAVIGDNIKQQISDKDLNQLTVMMYGRIPKKKELRADPSSWILSQNNILEWINDLDAFESALKTTAIGDSVEQNPLEGMNLRMEWVSPTSAIGRFVYDWLPNASGNHHRQYGAMRIRNVWKVEHYKAIPEFIKYQEKVGRELRGDFDKPLFQPRERVDLSSEEVIKYRNSHTAMLVHGTRGQNVSGILRERLRLPKQLVGVVLTAQMFGQGNYWASDWRKSAGYCSLNQAVYNRGAGGSVYNRGAFMFIADVILGKPYVARGAHGYTSAPNGYHSVYGKNGITEGWHGPLQNDEHITYEFHQNNLRYLVEFSC